MPSRQMTLNLSRWLEHLPDGLLKISNKVLIRFMLMCNLISSLNFLFFIALKSSSISRILGRFKESINCPFNRPQIHLKGTSNFKCYSNWKLFSRLQIWIAGRQLTGLTVRTSCHCHLVITNKVSINNGDLKMQIQPDVVVCFFLFTR